MTKFFNIFKQPCFWHISGAKKKISKKPVAHNFIWVPQFQENARTDGKMDGRMERRTEPIS